MAIDLDWSKLNPIYWFKNSDDPIPPKDKWVNKPNWLRYLLWYFRNPLHNFNFYVIGLADKEFKRYGIAPKDVFNPNSRWNFCFIIHKCQDLIFLFLLYSLLRSTSINGYILYGILLFFVTFMPFISYHNNKIKFYVGWRERGNLGLKLTRKRA